jgi:hypothetical protein
MIILDTNVLSELMNRTLGTGLGMDRNSTVGTAF